MEQIGTGVSLLVQKNIKKQGQNQLVTSFDEMDNFVPCSIAKGCAQPDRM